LFFIVSKFNNANVKYFLHYGQIFLLLVTLFLHITRTISRHTGFFREQGEVVILKKTAGLLAGSGVVVLVGCL